MGIKTFQNNNNLIPDGIVGIKTILKIKEVFNLNIIEASHFIAQIDHETGNFKYSLENLNYSESRLLVIFKKYFNKETAKLYARNPEKIANKVYANRMGNGNESSGDGWNFRGKGSLQLTGYENYKRFSKYINDNRILKNTDLVATEYYLDSAIWYFKVNNIFLITNNISGDTIRKVTKKINGGYNGIEHRRKLTKKYYNLLREYEEQDSNRIDSNPSSSSGSIVVQEQQEPKEINRNTEVRESESIKEGLLSRLIRWILRQIGRRQFEQATT